MASEQDDDVGYGRPPSHSRFKKGHSGNPKGRPRGATSFKSDLAAELRQKLTLTENGKELRISKQQALVKTLTAAAIKKDIRAVNALLAFMRLFGVGGEEATSEAVDVDDLELLEGYVAQQRHKQKREASPGTRPKSTPKQPKR